MFWRAWLVQLNLPSGEAQMIIRSIEALNRDSLEYATVPNNLACGMNALLPHMEADRAYRPVTLAVRPGCSRPWRTGRQRSAVSSNVFEPSTAAGVFSRASRGELETRLKEFEQDRLDAADLSRRLDIGYTLNSFGAELLEQWTEAGEVTPLMLFRLMRKPLLGKRAAIVLTPLQSRLPEAVLKSTARTTMATLCEKAIRLSPGIA